MGVRRAGSHDPVRTLVRTTQAKAAYWAGQFAQSAEFARDGLRYGTGTNAVLLASMEAAPALV